jgi:hypothetical protein
MFLSADQSCSRHLSRSAVTEYLEEERSKRTVPSSRITALRESDRYSRTEATRASRFTRTLFQRDGGLVCDARTQAGMGLTRRQAVEFVRPYLVHPKLASRTDGLFR